MMRTSLRRCSSVCSFLALCALLLMLVLGSAPVRAQTLDDESVPGEVLIGWQPGAGPVPEVRREAGRMAPDQDDPLRQIAVQEIRRLTGLEVLGAAPEYGIARLAVEAGSEAAEIARLEALPWVRYAEPNHYAYAAGEILIPNDPDYPKQWNMDRVAAPDAWAATRGSISFVVAVLDTGVAQNHPEFVGKLLPGWDYVNSDNSPEDDHTPGHGTHIAGIIAAGFNNGVGVAGLAPDVKILPYKVLNSEARGSYYNIAQAARHAADYGAQVINLSIAGYVPDQTLREGVAYAVERGALVVAAGGNCAQDPSNCGGTVNPDMYPAAYPGVLAVSSSDSLDRATIYSGYKPYIGLAAPGGTSGDEVWSTARFGYSYLYGTSISTAMASAAAALVWTLQPAASSSEVATILKNTADKVGTDPYSGQPLSYTTGRNDYFGYGRLNAGRAVCSVYPLSLTPTPGLQTFVLGEPVKTQSRIVKLTNSSDQQVMWQAMVVEGGNWLSVSPLGGAASYSAPGELTLKAELGTLAPGTYNGTVRVRPLNVACLVDADIRVQLRVFKSVSRLYLPILRGAQ